MSSGHRTVLLHEVVDQLAIASGTYVDATLGAGGHAQAIIDRLDLESTFIGLDADSEAIEAAKKKFADAKPKVVLVHANFRTLKSVLREHHIDTINGIVFDLGWRIEQLTGRGFSFDKDEPLLMTFDPHPPLDALTAQEIVNTWDEPHIADILYGWGGEHFSRRIAKAIVERRATKPIESTVELAELVSHATPVWYRTRRIHPATKTFQALRIAVNDEVGALREGLASARDILANNGRIAVITFHSVEDREVKHVFRHWESEGTGKVLTKKPITATEEELAENPRARSAKLRVYEKHFS
ncbi:16S rRNA (cytosine(1402)-N(4))-methyltransferase RsmH [Candidatus Kaiserbacteria bacterium]|nr:16S rRNA (cytosine(1402)-N(4))-methyltransferase RsmH [Candidatus Kaiserbacteria bacterium]